MHVITRSCPVACLAPLLSRVTFCALAEGMQGSPATVGQVVELYEQRRLIEIENISTGRCGEIRRSLVKAGLIEAEGRGIVTRGGGRNGLVAWGHGVEGRDGSGEGTR